MSLARKISHLKDLSSLKTDRKWEKTTKYELLSEISSQNRLMQVQKLSGTEKFDMSMMSFINRIAPSFNKVVASFLVLMMSSGLGFAAKASVPGQPLWPIKRSIEKAELTLAFNSVKETEVHMNHVKERLKEIDKILEKGENNDPENKVQKEKAIKQAVTHLGKDVTAADSSLKVAKEEKKEKPLEVVALAKKVTDSAKEVASNLEETKKKVENSDSDLEEALDDAKKINDKAKKSAVSVALEVHEEVVANLEETTKAEEAEEAQDNTLNTGSAPLSEDIIGDTTNDTSTIQLLEQTKEAVAEAGVDIDTEEVEAVKALVTEMIASEIDEATIELEGVKHQVEVVDNDLEIIKKEKIEIEEVSAEEVDSELENIDEIKENPDQADQALVEAKALMQEGFLQDAYKKLSDVREKYQKAEDIMVKIKKAIQNHNTINPEVIEAVENIGENNITEPESEEKIIEEQPVETEDPQAKETEAEKSIEAAGIKIYDNPLGSSPMDEEVRDPQEIKNTQGATNL